MIRDCVSCSAMDVVLSTALLLGQWSRRSLLLTSSIQSSSETDEVGSSSSTETSDIECPVFATTSTGSDSSEIYVDQTTTPPYSRRRCSAGRRKPRRQRPINNLVDQSESTAALALIACDIWNQLSSRHLGRLYPDQFIELCVMHDLDSSVLVTSLIYAERLHECSRSWPDKYCSLTLTSSELCLVSMMLACKYLYDDGTAGDVVLSEWAAGGVDGGLRVSAELAAAELAALDALEWRMHVSRAEFQRALGRLEARLVAGQCWLTRRQRLTEAELVVLLADVDVRRFLVDAALLLAKFLALCAAAYLLSVCTLVALVQANQLVKTGAAGTMTEAAPSLALAPTHNETKMRYQRAAFVRYAGGSCRRLSVAALCRQRLLSVKNVTSI